jgi:hypothetical protein
MYLKYSKLNRNFFMKNICLVIVLVYNGGMVHIVVIKVHHLGERIQVLYVMQHINVLITI